MSPLNAISIQFEWASLNLVDKWHWGRLSHVLGCRVSRQHRSTQRSWKLGWSLLSASKVLTCAYIGDKRRQCNFDTEKMTSPLYTCVIAETSGYFGLQVVPEEAPERTWTICGRQMMPNVAKPLVSSCKVRIQHEVVGCCRTWSHQLERRLKLWTMQV